MIGRRLRACALLVATACLCSLPARAAASAGDGREPFTEMVVVVHLHTSLVDGASTPLEIARAARSAGIDALVVTDHLLERVSYAPWPIGNFVGVSFSRPSVLALGVERYLRILAEAERLVPGIVILPGVEVTPYARFSGSLLSGTLELEGWHRHLLLIGLEDGPAIARLPVLGNRAGGRYNGWSLLALIPAVVIVWTTRRILRPAEQEVRLGGFRLRRSRRPVPEAVLGVLCVGLMVVAFPFRVERYSPVGSDPGDAPYRDLIDRVHALGGIAYWAHPEAAADLEESHGFRLRTAPYPELAVRTGADGFGALPEGVKTLLPPGGIWDRALERSLLGPRPGSPLALAEVDEHRSAREIDFGALQSVVLVRETTRAGLLEALQSGRLYGRWTPRGRAPLRLADFRVEAEGRAALAGQSMAVAGPVAIHLRVEGGDGTTVTARLIRRGEVIWSARQPPPIDARIEDAAPRPTCYRIDVEGSYPYRLIGNPIAVLPGRTKE